MCWTRLAGAFHWLAGREKRKNKGARFTNCGQPLSQWDTGAHKSQRLRPSERVSRTGTCLFRPAEGGCSHSHIQRSLTPQAPSLGL